MAAKAGFRTIRTGGPHPVTGNASGQATWITARPVSPETRQRKQDGQDGAERPLSAEEERPARRTAWVTERRDLIVDNLRLVAFIARRYRNMGLDLEDLVQEGSIGLMEAAERFDPEYGVRFSTYAGWWIRQAITRALSRHSRVVRIPFRKSTLYRMADRARKGIESRLGRRAGIAEIAEALGASAEYVDALLSVRSHVESLDALVSEDGSYRWELQPDEKTLSPWEAALERDLRDRVTAIVALLPPRLRLIVRMRFGIGFGGECSLREIGEGLALSRERIRQLEREALDRLRVLAQSRHLEDLVKG